MTDGRRIAIVAPSAYPLGGVQTWLDYLVPGLSTRGWSVTVLLTHGPRSDAHHYLDVHPFSDVRLVANPTGSREGRVRALERAIEACKADVVMCVNVVDVYEAVTRLRAKGCRLRVVATEHALNVCYFDDLATWRHAIDAVVATNRLATAAAEHYGHIPRDRVYYAQYGVPLPERLAGATGRRGLTLLFAGRFDNAQKRVTDLPGIVQAIRRRGVECTMRVAGSGPDEGALRLGLAPFGDAIQWVGKLDYAAMSSFFEAGAIGLVTSEWETGPLVAYEAMARGVTVVTSRFCGIGLERSLRSGETCLTYEIGNLEQAADAVVTLLDVTRRNAIAEAGHAMVRNRYSEAASVRAWDEALSAIVAREPLSDTGKRCEPSMSGRLDRLFGVTRAEQIRRTVGVSFQHQSAGGEWPHSYGGEADSEFLAQLKQLDRRVEAAA